MNGLKDLLLVEYILLINAQKLKFRGILGQKSGIFVGKKMEFYGNYALKNGKHSPGENVNGRVVVLS